jgi:hypothetical protein
VLKKSQFFTTGYLEGSTLKHILSLEIEVTVERRLTVKTEHKAVRSLLAARSDECERGIDLCDMTRSKNSAQTGERGLALICAAHDSA